MSPLDKIKQVLIPKALEELNKGEILEEVEGRRSQMKRNTFTFENDSYTVMEQNVYKTTKYADLAKKGHHVVWLVRESDGDWFLIVDGAWVDKRKVTSDAVPANAVY